MAANKDKTLSKGGGSCFAENSTGYEELNERFGKGLAAWFNRLTGDAGESETLVHDTITRFLEKVSDPSTVNKTFWFLARIGTNLFIDKERRIRSKDSTSLDDDRSSAVRRSLAAVVPDPNREMDREDFRLAMRVLIRTELKKPRDRELINLLFVEGCTVEEIAEITGEPLEFVKKDRILAMQNFRYRLVKIMATKIREAGLPETMDGIIVYYTRKRKKRDLSPGVPAGLPPPEKGRMPRT